MSGSRSSKPMPATDRELFEQAMADVRRLEHDRHLPEPVFRSPVIPNEQKEVLRELDRLISGEAPLEMRQTDEYIEGAVPGLDRRILRRLHRGEFSVQAELDLHGVAVEGARRGVADFLANCQTRGLRCVRIVHGRGRNSPGRVPVLKEKLPGWLTRGAVGRLVLAYTTAAPRDGGAGATYVLLRRPRHRRSQRDAV